MWVREEMDYLIFQYSIYNLFLSSSDSSSSELDNSGSGGLQGLGPHQVNLLRSCGFRPQPFKAKIYGPKSNWSSVKDITYLGFPPPLYGENEQNSFQLAL